MPSYKITYFNIKALAEPLRFLLSYGGIEFEDVRISDNWPAIKSTMPMGQMPILEVDGKVVHQSIAMARYLGKQVNLAGNNDWENLMIDIAADTINDLRKKIISPRNETNETIKAERFITLTEEIIPFYLEKLDKMVQDNRGYLALGRLTWADMYFVAILDTLNVLAKQDLTAKWSNLKALKEKVLGLDSIKKWIVKRPVSEF